MVDSLGDPEPSFQVNWIAGMGKVKRIEVCPMETIGEDEEPHHGQGKGSNGEIAETH